MTRSFPTPHRRGTIYVLVLSLAGLLAVIAVGAGAYTSAESRLLRESEARGVAVAAAHSALEAAVAMVQADPTGADWRPRADQADFAARRSLDAAAVSVSLQSSDLTTRLVDWDGSIIIDSTAWYSGWRHGLRATLEPVVANLGALSYPLVVGGDLKVTGTSLTGSGVVLVNGTVEASSAQIGLAVHASSTTGSTFSTTPVIRAKALPLPGPDLIPDYVARATPIEISQLPSRVLEKVVLSSARNPFGSTNADGIYTIRCAGQDVTIRNVRVIGTLILENPGPGSIITGRVCFEQAAANQPVLLVDGSISMQTESGDLSEATITTNLNPSGAPFRGVTDSDTTDFYASVFEGIVYIRSNLTSTGSATFEGSLIVGGTASTTSPLVVRYFAPQGLVPSMTTTASWRLLDLERIMD
jgi:hypothetical protein